LIIPSGRGGALAVYRNLSGRFSPFQTDALKKPAARDQTTILGLDRLLVVGASNYDDGTTNGGWARVIDLGGTGSGEILLNPKGCTGPLAMADINGDGALDLFVGARAISRKYPHSTPSMVCLSKGNRFDPAQTLDAGIVSGAVFSDLDDDGDAELVLACHWGPVRVFRNDKGRFVEATESLGLSPFKGLWNGVATADLNNDGRPDIIASNWGRNSRWQASPEKPLKFYAGDFDQDGTVDMVDAFFDPALGREVPHASLRFLGRALPELNGRMPTFGAFAAASLKDILNTDELGTPLEVTTLSTTVFLNEGGRFTARELPVDAQFTPAFGIAPGDFNGDGNDDVYLAQNFFGTNPEMARPDPGRGLLLLGDGAGALTVAPSQKIGASAYGEQRGCAAADFDRDGRLDLALAQNSAQTKLFRNQGSARCLAVTLVGTAPNAQAVGGALRVGSSARAASRRLREIQRGGGYWSVNSPTQLLGGREEIQALEVRFPGKDWRTVKVPPQAWEITINETGEVRDRTAHASPARSR
jgi:enediyne biosynthesis protein E4